MRSSAARSRSTRRSPSCCRPGSPAPTRDKTPITLRHLALHSSGLPRLPPSLVAAASGSVRGLRRGAALPGPDRDRARQRAGHEDRLLELRRRPARVRARPQDRRRLRAALAGARAHAARAARDTIFGFPPGAAARAQGTNDDLEPAVPLDLGCARGRGRAGLDRARPAPADRRRARRGRRLASSRCARRCG